MDMFAEIGKIEESVGGSYKMPVGEHPATVSDLKLDHESGYVDFKYNFIGAGVFGFNRWFLKGKDAEKTKKAVAMISKQLRNAGFEAHDGPSLGRAISQLEGASVTVDVTNDKNNDKYQRYWITGKYIPKRETVAAPGSATDDGLPFAILLAPLAAAIVGIIA